MKKMLCAIMAALLILLTMNCAAAERTVFLPESSYRLTVPDGMEYDGPGTGKDSARFAYVSAGLGLEIHFFLYNRNGAALEDMVAPLLEQGVSEAGLWMVNGIRMIVFRADDPADPPKTGMKCIGYVLFRRRNGAHASCLRGCLRYVYACRTPKRFLHTP